MKGSEEIECFNALFSQASAQFKSLQKAICTSHWTSKDTISIAIHTRQGTRCHTTWQKAAGLDGLSFLKEEYYSFLFCVFLSLPVHVCMCAVGHFCLVEQMDGYRYVCVCVCTLSLDNIIKNEEESGEK